MKEAVIPTKSIKCIRLRGLTASACVEQLAQEDGGAETHGVECDGKRHSLCKQYVDDMRHERAHGRVIGTVE